MIGLAQHDASSTLKTAGFKVSVQTRVVTDPKQDGIVLDQSPKGGTPAPAGTTVTILVGKFPGSPKPSPSPTTGPGGAPGAPGSGVAWVIGPWLLVPTGGAAALRGRTRRRR